MEEISLQKYPLSLICHKKIKSMFYDMRKLIKILWAEIFILLTLMFF